MNDIKICSKGNYSKNMHLIVQIYVNGPPKMSPPISEYIVILKNSETHINHFEKDKLLSDE